MIVLHEPMGDFDAGVLARRARCWRVMGHDRSLKAGLLSIESPLVASADGVEAISVHERTVFMVGHYSSVACHLPKGFVGKRENQALPRNRLVP